MDWLFDARTSCWSLQTTMTVRSYLKLVDRAHQTQGALSGQRDVLTTTTAKRIRSRMVSDLKLGAVLPPVVVGAVVSDEIFTGLPRKDVGSIEEVLSDSDLGDLSIIDGMQRTAAILEASSDEPEFNERSLRVEFWLATSVRAMIYRMLVLNTGQVPWTMSRQLSVVFAPLLKEIRKNVPELEKVPSPDNPGRRVGAAQYSSDAIVELYIAFSLRKTAVDTKEAVSDEFSRLDFVENLADEEFQSQFYGALSLLARLDKAFARYDQGEPGRFTKGRNIFDGQPARIGFVVAVGAAVLGRPGASRSAPERSRRMESLATQEAVLIERLKKYSIEELADYLRLDVLREVLDRRVGQVGRYERAVFAEAFKVLVDEEFLDSEPGALLASQLMSRNMIGANQQLFATLERYCLVRDQPIESGGGRYVATDTEAKRLLKDLRVGTCIRFGNHRSLTHLFLSDLHYIGTVGFEFEPCAPNLSLIENSPGLTVCLLVESKASPLASPPAVRNIVEAGSMIDADYSGHEAQLIESLFPAIQVLQSIEPLDEDSVWRLCLIICAEECRQGGSWIDDKLALELVALTDLNIPSMPYSAICRSIFDADPRSLFMALYRCLEATYSHQSSRRLIEKLALNISWQDMAAALESEIGWHPQESASLNVVLQHTAESDLEAICDCLRVDVGKDVQASAGRAVYSLRNSVVHFRPGTREIGLNEIDWNRLCHLLIRVVFDIFIQAYA